MEVEEEFSDICDACEESNKVLCSLLLGMMLSYAPACLLFLLQLCLSHADHCSKCIHTCQQFQIADHVVVALALQGTHVFTNDAMWS